MNLSENLKRIRKDNNLSQEQLADKLGVSRQSVSKWESGLAYPEMDKVLQICKIFNLNIDELLNQNLKEVNEIKQSKNNVNKFIDDFLDYITKTIDMFSCMKFKDKFKCLFEQVVIIGVITLVLLIFGIIVRNIVSSVLGFLPSDLYYTLYNILINGIYLLFCLIFGVSLVLYIFKVRYLDYYVIIREKANSNDEKLLEEEKVENEKDSKKENNKKFFHKEKETIIIREPKHSGYKFISGLVKCLLFLLKSFVGIIAFCLCVSFVCLVLLTTLSFLFIKTGITFIGILLILISFLIVNLIILDICYKFIINKKKNNKLLSMSFIISCVLLGIGAGLAMISLKDFKYINDFDNSRYVSTEEILQMKDNMFIKWIEDEKFIVEDRKDIRIEFYHSKFMKYQLNQYDNGHIEIWFNKDYENVDPIEEINAYLDDLNNKRFVEYYNYDIKVYASKENIQKLKNNRDKYYEQENNYQSAIEGLIDERDELNNKIYQYEEDIRELENEIENNKETISDLEKSLEYERNYNDCE